MMNLYVNIIMLKYPMIVELCLYSAAVYRFNPKTRGVAFDWTGYHNVIKLSSQL